MYLKKTPNTNGRVRLSIVDNYYDKQKKCSRQKTIESIGFLDELEKIYDDPISHFQKRVELLNQQKRYNATNINIIKTQTTSQRCNLRFLHFLYNYKLCLYYLLSLSLSAAPCSSKPGLPSNANMFFL